MRLVLCRVATVRMGKERSYPSLLRGNGYKIGQRVQHFLLKGSSESDMRAPLLWMNNRNDLPRQCGL